MRKAQTQLMVFGMPLAVACTAASNQPPSPLDWPPGEYELYATVSYGSAGITKRDEHAANLVIGTDGTLSMIASTGLCQDPSPDRLSRDRAQGVRTFVCGGARYELRPAGATIRGRVNAIVSVEEVITECVEYQTNPDGLQVCVRYEDRIVSRLTTAGARLNVRQKL